MKKLSVFWQHRFESVSALAVMLWGLFLLNPYTESFAGKSYSVVAKYTTENQWGSVALLIGIFGLIGLYFRNRPLRKISLFFCVAYRVFTLVLSGIPNKFANPGTADFFVWALIAISAYISMDHDS